MPPLLILIGASALGAGVYWVVTQEAARKAEVEATAKRSQASATRNALIAAQAKLEAEEPEAMEQAKKAVADFKAQVENYIGEPAKSGRIILGRLPSGQLGFSRVGTVSMADIRQARREAKYAKAQAQRARSEAREASAEARQVGAEARGEKAGVRAQKARGQRISYQVEEEEARHDVEAARRGEDYTPGDMDEDWDDEDYVDDDMDGVGFIPMGSRVSIANNNSRGPVRRVRF